VVSDDDDAEDAQPWQTQYVGDIDRSQPWQAQHAERLSRGLNQKSPWVRHQLAILGLGLTAIVVLTVLLFILTKG
jgi:hypothetical protein